MPKKWEIICFYRGKRQPRFTVFSVEQARYWHTWVFRNDPNSKPEIKEVNYAVAETTT